MVAPLLGILGAGLLGAGAMGGKMYGLDWLQRQEEERANARSSHMGSILDQFTSQNPEATMGDASSALAAAGFGNEALDLFSAFRGEQNANARQLVTERGLDERNAFTRDQWAVENALAERKQSFNERSTIADMLLKQMQPTFDFDERRGAVAPYKLGYQALQSLNSLYDPVKNPNTFLGVRLGDTTDTNSARRYDKVINDYAMYYSKIWNPQAEANDPVVQRMINAFPPYRTATPESLIGAIQWAQQDLRDRMRADLEFEPEVLDFLPPQVREAFFQDGINDVPKSLSRAKTGGGF